MPRMEERRPWSRFIKWGSEMAVHFPVTHSLCIKYILWGQCFWPVNSRCGGRWLTLTEYSQALVLLNGFYDCSYFCLFMLRYGKIKNIYLFRNPHFSSRSYCVWCCSCICSILHLPITKLINKKKTGVEFWEYSSAFAL